MEYNKGARVHKQGAAATPEEEHASDGGVEKGVGRSGWAPSVSLQMWAVRCSGKHGYGGYEQESNSGDGG
ncbi:hypothetical protein B296_00029515 [Ensete ventricosum]|uniref:Uncharacterized protein n=1 Tax=Ensete ventricosum TaxID=4639 RepID=A0A426Y2T5_ENSVE|nr:hypothetical protein B296_00029515 [Ensete ventricosum]